MHLFVNRLVTFLKMFHPIRSSVVFKGLCKRIKGAWCHPLRCAAHMINMYLDAFNPLCTCNSFVRRSNYSDLRSESFVKYLDPGCLLPFRVHLTLHARQRFVSAVPWTPSLSNKCRLAFIRFTDVVAHKSPCGSGVTFRIGSASLSPK